MTSNSLNKITATLLVLAIVLGVYGAPRKAEAQLGTLEVNSTATLFQQIAQTLSTATSAFATYSLEFKAFVLDTLATTLAKQLIRQITASTVNWINSGFEGSPSFITNPGSFFIDVADQITGEFLAETGGPLTELCSPFSIDIRVALAFKYHPKIQKRYACTLGTIITNSKNAVKGASINGFTAGDFSQGGWPAFVALTTEPQNNIYGAYLRAESELSLRVANAQISKKDEISNGKGFLSWRNPKCKAEVKQHNATVSAKYEASSEDAYYESLETGTGEGYYSGEVGSLKSINDCPIETPGSLIGGSIQNHLNGPLREIELVDSINEVVSALAAQLINTVLTGGLRAVSGSGPSDSTSYVYQIQNEANTDMNHVENLRNNFIKSVGKYITDTLEYKTNKDQSLNLILDVKNKYDEAKRCYDEKIAGPPPLQGGQLSIAESRKVGIDAVVTLNITPLATKLLAEAREADTRYITLTNLRDQANAATTVNELSAPTQTFSQMLQNQDLTDANDIVGSQRELEEVRESASDLRRDAERTVQECQIFR
ncbi:MAG: hypothetical protein Q8Q03_01145 [bacterium]|nr:hypothetical protein [bacterium]